MAVKIGAHLSSAGGYSEALIRARDIGANALQLFSSSPRMWTLPEVSQQDCDTFVQLKKDLHIDPVYFHASYLVNLAGTERILSLSKEALITELRIASRLGIRGTIIHTGSYKEGGKEVPPLFQQEKYEKLVETIKEILNQTPRDTFFILENAGSHKIGATVEELGKIIRDVDSPRVKICIDTCHAHAAGYDFSTQEKLNSFLEKIDRVIGLSRLEVFQVNDSRDDFGSFRDRHENIGEGTMGKEPFRLLLHDERTRSLPFILEVPGFEKKGPDAKNIELLKQLSL